MCSFIDMVPVFRELAEITMGDMILKQKDQIVEIVSPRLSYFQESLRSNEGVVEWTDAETALTAGLYHLRHLAQVWKPILSHDVYGRSMGNLIDTLFSLYFDQVISSKDISEPACHFLSSLFKDAMRGVVELFVSSGSASVDARKDATRFCSLWERFAAIGNFMDMSLADTRMALSDGIFRSMTGTELSRLIMAVFAKTETRQKLLDVLSSK